MDLIRKEARQVLQQSPWNRQSSLDSAVSARLNLADVWADVSSHEITSHFDVSDILRPNHGDWENMLIGD